MKLGIVGLPNVGKSTLFNAITNAGAESANYPFCTIEPNVGVVSVPDKRLDVLGEMFKSKKIIHTAIEFFDIAGLVKGASKGEGLGNKFLSHIREVEAIVHVVRCFEDDDVTHVEGTVDPIRDIEIIDFELMLSDIETIQKRIQKLEKMAKADKKYRIQIERFQKIIKKLEEGISLRAQELLDDDIDLIKDLNLLTIKPILYAANVAEDDIAQEDNKFVQKVKKHAEKENSEVIVVCGKIESELAQLEEEEKKEFLEELGLKESGLDKLIRASYKLLGLISYLTAGEKETKAWTIIEGTKAPQAAGKIHTDFEKGFIRAEVVNYSDLVENGSKGAARDKGLVRLEGKEYIMKDGDVVEFRFNN